LHRALEDSDNDSQQLSLTAKDWLTLLSGKVNSLYKAEQSLVDTLKKSNHGINDKITTTGTFSSLDSDHRYIDLIKTLPLFSNLPSNISQQLLQSAHTREYKKGKILFLEGEQPTLFYIILRGWVKLYKGSVVGEETILQMLSCGDCLIESAIFLNAPYPLSAQIAENALLLSFPAPMIRQLIRSNNELAMNMLTNLSQRSQFLLQQVETTRLKSASERVGWFLLKTLISQREGNNHVKLPYDKAMIASYLDMKPETFSRTLKRFKDQGFHIDNDTIMLPDISALCGYCDINIAPSCARHNTKDCPNSHCTD
jgi:CRP-like cAMP-binding protein